MDTAIHSFAWHASLEHLAAVITRSNRLEVSELVQTSCMAVSPLDDLVICGGNALSLLKKMTDDGRGQHTAGPDLVSAFYRRALASYGFDVSFLLFMGFAFIFPISSNEPHHISWVLLFQIEVNIKMVHELGDIHLEHFWVFIENILK